MRATVARSSSTYHNAPSEPVVIGDASSIANAEKLVMIPEVVIRPTRLNCSVNHSAPSGPTVIAPGSTTDESVKSCTEPSDATRPIDPATGPPTFLPSIPALLVNHTPPSGPTTIPRALWKVPGNTLIVPRPVNAVTRAKRPSDVTTTASAATTRRNSRICQPLPGRTVTRRLLRPRRHRRNSLALERLIDRLSRRTYAV
jgi:hypothetical protein